ncbi:MAG TPA: hypothetical protein VFT62_08285 [Mycobacteriales bacterium]|nr:hypothetical protein [Mycobacteriales bacterium]
MTETSPQQPPDDLPDFGLVDDVGNQRLDLLVREVGAVIRSGSAERAEAVEALSDGFREISAQHPDATDITVRDAVVRELKAAFEEADWPLLEPFEF